MKKSFFLSLLFFLFFLYYFLFPLNADKEYIWQPRTVSSLDGVNGMAFPFLKNPVLIKTGEYGGILFPEGKSILKRTDKTLRDYSRSHTFKSNGPDSTALLNRTNNRYVLFQGRGAPLIVNDHYLLADFSQGFIREVDSSGNILWSWEGVSPLTALSASGGNVAFGTLDGMIHIYRKDGNNGFLEPFPEGGDSIIYGLSFSPDSGRMAAVAGRNRQTLILYDESAPLDYKELRRFSLDSRYSRPVKVSLSSGGEAVWVEQPGRVSRFSEEGDRQEYPFSGQLLSMNPDEENSMVFLLSAVEEGKNLLSVFSLAGDILMEEELEGVLSHFRQDQGQLSLISGGNLLLINREIY